MASININKNVTDPFYRYKMPKINAKVEGKGNGIKTVIVNMTEVAKAVGRPPTYPTKYFGYELGAQTQFDNKHDRYIVNGSHESTKLQDLLNEFIRKYVLCPECENPETDLIVNVKKANIGQNCKACGFHGLLKSKHKLNTFIIKNPPNTQLISNVSLTDNKRSKKVKKSSNTFTNDDERNKSMESITTMSGSELNVAKEETEAEQWTVDLSEEAVQSRLMDLTHGVKQFTQADDLEKSENERMDQFYDMVKMKIDQNTIESVDQQREILLEAERLLIKSKSILVLVELLFDQNIANQIKKYRKLFLRFTIDDRKAQKHLISGIEQIISLHKQTLLPKAAGIFQLFYDLDIITEDEFLGWDKKMVKKQANKGVINEIHKIVQPFINWLKEAEEESDSSETSSSSELDIVNLNPRPALVLNTNTNTNNEDDSDDLDIDAI